MEPEKYSAMSPGELQEERKRIVKRLLAEDAPRDPMERLAYFEQRVLEQSDPAATQLIQVDNALWNKDSQRE